MDTLSSLQQLLCDTVQSGGCVDAVYNKGKVRLAPRIIYSKREGLFVDAFVMERGATPPKEQELRSFKLVGLTHVQAVAVSIIDLADWDHNDPKYLGATICVAEKRPTHG